MGALCSSKKFFPQFEFSEADEAAEKKSRWKPPARRSKNKEDSLFGGSAIDKYTFLQSFEATGGTETKGKNCRNEQSVVDELEKTRISRPNAASQSSTSYHKSETRSRPKYLESSSSYCEGNANTSRNLNSTRHDRLPDNEPVLIYSDEEKDDISTLSSSDLEDNEGSLGEQIIERDITARDSEFVVLNPQHVICGGQRYCKSQLTFSCNSIKLDVSQKGAKDAFEWKIADLIYIESRWCERFETATVCLNMKSEHSKVVANGQDSGILEVRFVVCDPHWIHKEELIKLLDVRYKEIWDDDLDLYESFEDVTYPEGCCDSISISKRDIQLLRPEKFINDTIVDFYIGYLKNKMKAADMQRVHFFSSFFFRKLADFDGDQSKSFDSNEAFQRVRKWTKKVNIFEKDYIFIPVNFRLHWSLLVICHPGEVVNFRDEELEISPKVPCILHMDSLKGSHTGLRKCIQSYLQEEWKERSSGPAEDTSSKFLNMLFLRLEVPQQQNSFDCGLFMLHYMELFVKQAPNNFNPLSTSLSKDWFSPAEASAKRTWIRRLIFEIAKHNRQRSPSSSCNDKCTFESKVAYAEETDIQFVNETHNSHGSKWNTCADESKDMKPSMVKPIRSVPPSGCIDECSSESEDVNEEETDFKFFPMICNVKEHNVASNSDTGPNDNGVDGKNSLASKFVLRESQADAEMFPVTADNRGSLVAGHSQHHQQLVLYNPSRVLSPVKECKETEDALVNQLAVPDPHVASIGSSLNLLQLEENYPSEELSDSSAQKDDNLEAFVVEDSYECPSSPGAHPLEVVQDSDSEYSGEHDIHPSENPPCQGRIFASSNQNPGTPIRKAVIVNSRKREADLEEAHAPKRRRRQRLLRSSSAEDDVLEVLNCE